MGTAGGKYNKPDLVLCSGEWHRSLRTAGDVGMKTVGVRTSRDTGVQEEPRYASRGTWSLRRGTLGRTALSTSGGAQEPGGIEAWAERQGKIRRG
jgi:hypothetical protein